MARLKAIRTEVDVLNRQLKAKQAEQKQLMSQVGDFLTRTGRQKVQMGDLVVKSQTKTKTSSFNLVSGKNRNQTLEELQRVGVTVTAEQLSMLVAHLRSSRAKTTQQVRLLTAS